MTTLSPDFIPRLKAGEDPDSEDKPLLFVMRMDWLGKVVGPNQIYDIVLSDGNQEITTGFTSDKEYCGKLYGMLKGKRKRLLVGSIVKLQQFFVRVSPSGSRRVIIEKLSVVKRVTELAL
jgi:hypothetical protein